jgi:hypothetical protein
MFISKTSDRAQQYAVLIFLCIFSYSIVLKIQFFRICESTLSTSLYCSDSHQELPIDTHDMPGLCETHSLMILFSARQFKKNHSEHSSIYIMPKWMTTGLQNDYQRLIVSARYWFLELRSHQNLLVWSLRDICYFSKVTNLPKEQK